MPFIKCNVAACIHNKSSKCQKHEIAVEGQHAKTTLDTMCESFDFTSKKKNYSYEFATFDDKKTSTNIWCDAIMCKHIKNGKCRANAIIVDGNNAKINTETSCKTFEK